jgi:hypothetical protein
MIDAGTIGEPPAAAPATTSGTSLQQQEDALSKMTGNEVDSALQERDDPDPDPEEEPPATEVEPTEPAKPGEEPPAEETEAFESEQAYLEAHNIKGHESISTFLQEQQEQVSELMNTFRLAGMDPTKIPDNLADLNKILVQELAMRQMNPDGQGEPEPAKVEEAPIKLDMKGFFGKYKDQLDPEYMPMYEDLASTVAAQVLTQIKGGLPKIDADTDPGHLGFEMMLYNEAKAAAGDRPIPPFGQARQLVRAMKDSLSTYRFMAGRVGSLKDNPYMTAFETFAASKAPGGITKAQEAKSAAGAKKVLIARKMLSATPASRPQKKSFEELSRSEQTAALAKMDA